MGKASVSVEIVSQETIRPSSPTPPHLRMYKLSLLDQLGALFYVPITLFYSVDDTGLEKAVEQLKRSLPETLSVFYPLAGRTIDHLSIDCNDEGVEFSVAKLEELHLQKYLDSPDLDLLPLFLPNVELAPTQQNLNAAVPTLAVQVSVFKSGGFAIGLRFLHQITDANTIASFLKVWTGIARGEITSTSEIKPDFAAASVHFPPLQETLGADMMLLDMNWIRKKEKGVRSRVVFDAAAIAALRARAAAAEEEEEEENRLPNPTRFEVVTSLIWKHALLAAAADNSDADQHQQQTSMMMVPVNMRPRTGSPMDKDAIGSLVWMGLAHHPRNKKTEELGIGRIGSELRGAVKKLVTDLVSDEEPLSAIQRQIKEAKKLYSGETPDVYSCSSWCAFPFNEVDFGWGKPAWVAFTWRVTAVPMYVNGMILIRDKSGEGVEAWLLLGENQTTKLFSDAEFLKFASVNPSIARESEQELPSATAPEELIPVSTV